MSLTNTFPEFDDEDDEFLPFPDDDQDDSDGWPEFDELEWRNFPHSRIVSITAIPSDEDRNDLDHDTRKDPILTLSSMAVSSMAFSGMADSGTAVSNMAGATVELSSTPRPTAPNKMKRLRKKLPKFLRKSSRTKQPSPGDQHVCFEERDIQLETRDNTFPQQVDFFQEHDAKQVPRPIYRETRDVILPRQLEMFNDRIKQVSRPTGGQELCCSHSNWNLTTNLFHDKTFPSNMLDFFGRNPSLAKLSEEETVSSSSSSNAPSLPGGVVDEKLAHVFGLSSIHEDMPDYDNVPTQASKGSSSGGTIHNVPASSIALCRTTEVNASSEPACHIQEKPADEIKAFTHLRPSGNKVADRQKWLNGTIKRPEVNKDSVRADKTKETDKTRSNVTGRMETIGSKESSLTDMSKGTDKTSSNVTGTIEMFGSKNSILSDSKAMMADMANVTPKTSTNETEMMETLGNKGSLLTDSKAMVTPKTSTNVMELIEKFVNKESFLDSKASSNVTGMTGAFGNKNTLLTDSKAKVTDTAQLTPKTSSDVMETIETFGDKESLLTDNVKVTPKTSFDVTGMIEKFGKKDSFLTDSKAKVTDTAKLADKTSSSVVATIKKFGNKDSLLMDKTKVTENTSLNVTGTSEMFGNKGSVSTDKAVTAKTSTNVTETIEKFGGKMTRQSRVQLRKQELESKLSLKNETLKNEGKPCFKTRWEGRPGAYKKKVVLSTYGY